MLEKFIILGSLSALVGFGLAYTMRLSVKAMLERSEAKRAKSTKLHS